MIDSSSIEVVSSNALARYKGTLFIFILSVGARIFDAQGATNETPRSAGAVLFQPCQWQLGDSWGPLWLLASEQNYTYTEYTNTVEPHPIGTLPANLNTFAGLSSAGILEIDTHGGGNHLQIECYPLTEKAAYEARYKQICGDDPNPPGGIKLTCGKDPKKVDVMAVAAQRKTVTGNGTRTENTNYAIALTIQGIKKLYHPKDHTIIFNGACHSWKTLPAFKTAAVEYLGYTGEVLTSQTHKDATKIFRRLSGRLLEGHARSMGDHNSNNRSNGKCTAFGAGGFATYGFYHDGPGNTTVAPAVSFTGADMLGGCKNGTYGFRPEGLVLHPPGRSGEVVFDTVMDMTKIPSQVIRTNGGCGSTIASAEWFDDHTIRFAVQIAGAGSVDLTVRNDFALSKHNARELDGSTGPTGTKGVGPNRDDYIGNNTCAAAFQSLKNQSLKDRSKVSFEPLIADLILSVIGTPVGVAGTIAEGAAELSSTEDVLGVSFFASDLTSGANVIPAAQISFLPGFLDLTASEVYATTNISADIPLGQPTGAYTGTLTASDGGMNTEVVPLTVFVNTPPVLTLPETAVTDPGQKVSIPISATDADGDPIVFFVNVLPIGAELFDYEDGTGLIEYTPPVDLVSPASITVMAYNPNIQGSPPPYDLKTLDVTVNFPEPGSPSFRERPHR
ncbi:MAG TPA: hypothetical protein VI895_10480 [Bdellovibrionota bacterium]|nr:hypothetical protein [Bdellovibrionota bacterium]